MRREIFILGLTLSAVVVVLVYGIGSHQSPSTFEPMRGETSQAKQTASVEAKLNESTEVVQQRSDDGYQKPTVTEAPRKYSSVDEAISRKEVRELSTQDIQRVYPFLLKGLDLTPSEKDALLSFLIEDLISKTKTFYSSGIGMDEHERSNRIAAIIGHSKLQQFLALERNLSSYRDLGRVGLAFQQNGVPLTDAQQDGLLEIFIDVRDQFEWMPPADVDRRSIEVFEHRLTYEDDYDRHVLELAPSVLSPKQVEYLFERYQALSYRRAQALEWHKQRRADNPDDNLTLSYPSRGY
jgi:hypothetical protein